MAIIPKKVLTAFRATDNPVGFDSGQGDAFRCGDKVIKRIENEEETIWIAEQFNALERPKTFFIPEQLKSNENKWVVDNWASWKFIPGEGDSNGKIQELFKICDDFHVFLKDVSKPDFIDKRKNPWSIADRVAWQEVEIKYDNIFMKSIIEIQKLLQPIKEKNQLMHGDIGGNIIFFKDSIPAVIDYSLYWRPAGFAKAVMVADNIAWEGAEKSEIKYLKETEKEAEQLLLRAILRRIVEQPEHVLQFGKDIDEAIESVNRYYEIVKMI